MPKSISLIDHSKSGTPRSVWRSYGLHATAWAALVLTAGLVVAHPAHAKTKVTKTAATATTPASNPDAASADSAVTTARGAPVTLNFVNADIEAVARAMSGITGHQVVVDPRAKGVINLSSDKPLSPAAAYNQFLAALRLQGYTVVQSGGLDKIVPEADAKLQSAAVVVGSGGSGGVTGNQIITQIFKLNFENANNLLPVLRSLISANNVINVNPGNNSLVITDYADNMQRLARIIAASDVPNASDIDVIALKHAIASDLAPLILRLIDSSGTSAGGQGQAETGFKTTVIAEPRSNALIVRTANAARAALVRSLVARLDQTSVQGDAGTGNIHVVYLKNADASKLATTLRAALSGNSAAQSTNVSGSAPGAPGGGSSQASSVNSTGGQVQADMATNALIISAPDPQYRQLREVIDKLDVRRAQVFVESLIVEVNANRAADMGIQWQGAIGNNGDGAIGLLGTNFGTGGKNIISLATGAASGTVLPSAGLNVGVARNYNGVYTLGFLARFLQQDADTNVLSIPTLFALDNEEAEIVVGQNVPFVTGQYTNSNSGGSGSVNPFQTIERKDVGISLKIKPQISENGTIKLSVTQEVSSVDSSSSAGLITNKRAIKSSIVVDDGRVAVLGGLLQDNYQGSKDRVPGLADIPLLGALFRSESRSRNKTNLMVFLRPVVVRDASGTEALAGQRYDQMRSLQQDAQPTDNGTLSINAAPVLPQTPEAGSPEAKNPLGAPSLAPSVIPNPQQSP